MEIRDLKFFCVTAEMEHVSKAAEKLGIAQPYLTKIIGQIESELGGALFDKVGRQIKLNDSGEVLYKHAKNVLSCLDNMYSEMDYVFEQKARMITLLCNTEAYTPQLIVDFQKKNANYGIKVSFATRKQMIEALKIGEADFALCGPPIEEEIVKNIQTEVVCRDVACALLPPNHPLLEKKIVTFDDLKDERLVTSTKGAALRSHVDRACEKYSIQPHIVCETNDANLIFQAVNSGLGFAFISHITLQRYPELRKYCVEIDVPDKYGEFGLSYNRATADNKSIADFREFTINYFAELQRKIANMLPPIQS